MLSAFSNSLKIPELRRRILFTFGLIFICRLVAVVPTPGVDFKALQAAVAALQHQAQGGFILFVDLFSGGAFSKCAVGALGIMPYISASIIFQLMTAIIPALERLAREGETGRQKLTQYTRYFTIVICMIQGFVLARVLESGMLNVQVVPDNVRAGPGFEIMTVLCLTTGTMLIMWLGEQITDRGIGNGISLVITVNIVSRIPAALVQTRDMFRTVGGVRRFNEFHLIWLVLVFFLVIAATIALTQGLRKIPIHTAKRVVGRKVYGGQNTYMPLRVNYSGVMPIIFASVMLQFPIVLMSRVQFLSPVANTLSPGKPLYMLVYGSMILFFSYFWVATQFNPLQIADDLKKNGGYVPGIRPGKLTAEFLDRTMTRITLVGAVSLTVIAVLPHIMYRQFKVPWLAASFLGGTSLLITVSVVLETMRQVESHLLTRHYDGFLKKGRLRGRR